DVGEGDLGGRGGKCNSDKQGQRLLHRVMAWLRADVVASSEAAWLVAAASGGEERKMSAAATTWLGGSNKMRLQDDEGGSWATLEMKGGGWVAAFGRTVGKKKRAWQQGGDDDSGRGDGKDNSVGPAIGNSGKRWGGKEEGATVMQLHGYAEEEQRVMAVGTTTAVDVEQGRKKEAR
ncbi:hypothetical protein BHE74_00058921, partial [Ensete ventricosum]